MALFTLEQAAMVRFHLGYPGGTQVVSIIAGARAHVTGATYTVDRSLELLDQASVPIVIDILGKLDKVRQYQDESVSSAEASRMGDLVLNPEVENRLSVRYKALQKELANLLGAEVNQYQSSGGSSLNGKWS